MARVGLATLTVKRALLLSNVLRCVVGVVMAYKALLELVRS